MDWEYTRTEQLRFKNEDERDRWLDSVYPKRVEDSFDKGTYWIDDKKEEKITVLWNVVQLIKLPIIVSADI